MVKKVCSKCKEEKEVCEFHKGKTKDGYQYVCKSCKKKYSVLNKEKENIRKIKWKINNPDKIRKSKQKYYQTNKFKEIKRNTNYINKKKKNNEVFKLSCIVRSRISEFLKSNNITKRNKTFDIVGCTPEFLKEYLEKQFTEGMSWELMGKHIHIDHIIPLSSAITEEEVYKLCHYTNLQPLWAEDNLKKSNKMVYN
jgi:hypothetical protein